MLARFLLFGQRVQPLLECLVFLQARDAGVIVHEHVNQTKRN